MNQTNPKDILPAPSPEARLSLPRLMYVGHVPVEAGTAGSALLYRLLERFPPEMLLIVEDSESVSTPSRRLPGVAYISLRGPWKLGWHFLRTRLPHVFWPLYGVYSGYLARRCDSMVRSFRPQAILTVHERFTWVTADRLARRHKLPLHLILHDDWFRNIGATDRFRKPSKRYISRIYRGAASRLCICPYMEEAYRSQYGCDGSVLYPSRTINAVDYGTPPERLQAATSQPVAMYAGNVFNGSYWRTLQIVAERLAQLGGKLVLYTPHSRSVAAGNGLTAVNVECRGLVSSNDLVGHIRAEAHFLFLPMSFDLAEKDNMMVSFPSKLVDYTSTGVPILIYGPHYCSAVRWAKDNPGTAEVVDKESVGNLAEALDQLVRDGDHRFRLGQRALDVGRRYFSHDAVEKVFLSHLAENQRIEDPLAL